MTVYLYLLEVFLGPGILAGLRLPSGLLRLTGPAATDVVKSDFKTIPFTPFNFLGFMDIIEPPLNPFSPG